MVVNADGPDFFDHVVSWVRGELCEAAKVAGAGLRIPCSERRDRFDVRCLSQELG